MNNARKVWGGSHPLEIICRWYNSDNPSRQPKTVTKFKTGPIQHLPDLLTANGLPADGERFVSLALTNVRQWIAVLSKLHEGFSFLYDI